MSENVGLGVKIKEFRLKLGMTQEEIAEYLGVDRVNISYYESGNRNVPTDKLQKLSDLYGVSISELLSDDPNIHSLNLQMAFRANSIQKSDREAIAFFTRIIKNYNRMQIIEKRHGK